MTPTGTLTSLLRRPHGLLAWHDGSALFVDPSAHHVGDIVELRLRTAAELDVQTVHVRLMRDGEPRFHPAKVVSRGDQGLLWSVQVPWTNTHTNYRFLLATHGTTLVLTASGLVQYDLPDSTDFRLAVDAGAPQWAQDAVFYQIFCDRFAPSTNHPLGPLPDWAVPAAWDTPVAANTPHGVRQVYGGSLWGVAEHLDHLVELGIGAIYLTPFFPAQSNHRYDATTFDHVDPLLGGDDALRALTTQARAKGIRVIGDLTLNHTGVGHEWFQRALSDPTSPERDFYLFNDDPTGPGYASFWGVPTLPKLDHRSPELRRRLYDGPDSVVARYVRDFGLSGWRIDVAQSAGIHGATDLNDLVARTTRTTLASIDPDTYLVAEIQHDPSAALQGGGWQGSMAYASFTRPLWSWLAGADVEAQWGVPATLARLDGPAMTAQMDAFTSRIPWASRTASLTLLDSHDTARLRSLTTRQLHHVAVVALMTMPGIPMIFSGDEVGIEGTGLEDGRRPFPWASGQQDTDTLALYQQLIRLRADHPALRHGGFRWTHVDPDTIAFERATPTETLRITISRTLDVASVTSTPPLVSGAGYTITCDH